MPESCQDNLITIPNIMSGLHISLEPRTILPTPFIHESDPMLESPHAVKQPPRQTRPTRPPGHPKNTTIGLVREMREPGTTGATTMRGRPHREGRRRRAIEVIEPN